MKVEELRIGNNVYLKLPLIHGTVTKIIATDLMMLEQGKDHLLPIPITDEWLERFGWVWNEECKSYEKYPNGDARMNLALKMGGSYTMFNYVLKAVIADRIYYVHQLQNLYFSLTSEELKLESLPILGHNK